MNFILMWFFMALGLVSTVFAAQITGFEYHIASLALVCFAYAFRCDSPEPKTVRIKKR